MQFLKKNEKYFFVIVNQIVTSIFFIQSKVKNDFLTSFHTLLKSVFGCKLQILMGISKKSFRHAELVSASPAKMR